ncbi:MAG: phenylacetate--CoA ligase family protein [Gammaproteobacteria bacterium]|nr:phenylacetate--CoA ligase family protein [Gammaproteobacteria bacterium]
MAKTHHTVIDNADFLDLQEIKRIQAARWITQGNYVHQCSPFYQRHCPQLSAITTLDALADLPFTDKEMLREDQRQHPPFGSYLSVSGTRIVRMHRTSGTTGTAMNLALTEDDAVMTAMVGARAQKAAGLGPRNRVIHCLNYQLWMGGYTDHSTLEATGAMVIPYGVGNTRGLIETIQNLQIDAISCTSSYPSVLAQTLEADFPMITPRDLGLKLGLFGGEPGLDDPAFRKKLEDIWGFDARNSNYGVTDVLCNFAGQSTLSNDLHLVALDVLYPELIDPVSTGAKQWKEGEVGELVLTHLCKQAQPLIRFRTGDIIEITGTDRAKCRRSAPRFRVIGRSDEMITIRGINVFPTMVAETINKISGLSGEYRITLDHPPPYQSLPIEVELSREHSSPNALVAEIQNCIKRYIGVHADVILRGSNTLPRTQGKTRRVIRTHKK